MGSKPVREAHMMKYGAPLSEMKSGLPAKSTPKELQESCERLSKPRVMVKKFSYEAHAGTAAVDGSDLFPPSGDVDEVLHIPCDGDYPVDWRKLPTSRNHGTDVKWLYTIVTLAMKATNVQKLQSEAKNQIERLLRQNGVSPVSHQATKGDIRSEVRDGRSFVILVDIIATRRSIMSGVPHDVAAALYKFLDEFYPIQVKFAFVGISDNATKLAARDVFNSSQDTSSKKLPFSAVDSEHLFVAHAKSDEGATMRERGLHEAQKKEEESRARRSTPKYIAPPEPAWLQRVKARASTPTVAPAKSMHLQTCDRCWSHSALRTSTTANSTIAAAEPVTELHSDELPVPPTSPENAVPENAVRVSKLKAVEFSYEAVSADVSKSSVIVSAESVAMVLAEKKRRLQSRVVTPARELLKVARKVSEHIRSPQ